MVFLKRKLNVIRLFCLSGRKHTVRGVEQAENLICLQTALQPKLYAQLVYQRFKLFILTGFTINRPTTQDISRSHIAQTSH